MPLRHRQRRQLQYKSSQVKSIAVIIVWKWLGTADVVQLLEEEIDGPQSPNHFPMIFVPV